MTNVDNVSRQGCKCGAYWLLKDVKTLLQDHPEELKRMYGLSIINVLQGNYTDALENLHLIISEKPDIALLQRRIGELFILRGEYAKAITPLEKAIELDSSDYIAITWLSLTYYRIGYKKKAIKMQEKLENYLILMSAQDWS